jgi:hypothetical protein
VIISATFCYYPLIPDVSTLLPGPDERVANSQRADSAIPKNARLIRPEKPIRKIPLCLLLRRIYIFDKISVGRAFAILCDFMKS